ncbi:MAG: hypothetical protein ACOZAR_04995 [Patescibacteria group bacterium]
MNAERVDAGCPDSPCYNSWGNGMNFGPVSYYFDNSSKVLTMHNWVGCLTSRNGCTLNGASVYVFIRVMGRQLSPGWNTKLWSSGDIWSAAGHSWGGVNLYTPSSIYPGSPTASISGTVMNVREGSVSAQFTDLNDGETFFVTPSYLVGGTNCNFGCLADNSYYTSFTYVKPNYYRPIFYQDWPPNGITMCYNGFGLQGHIRDYDYPSTGDYAKIYSTAYGWADVANSGNLGDWGTAAIGGRNWPSGNTGWYGYAYDRYGDGPTPGYYNFNINRSPSISSTNGPSCNYTYPQPQSFYFAINPNDPDGNYSSINVIIDGGTYGNGSWIYLNPGNHSWYGRVCDSCGQCAQTSTCNFRVNSIPTVSAGWPSAGCNTVTLSATAYHDFSPGDQAWIRFDYWGGRSGSATYQISWNGQSFSLPLGGVPGNSTVYWSATVWDSNGTSNRVNGQAVTPNCTPNPPYGFNQTINCANATLYASGSDPDGGQLYMTFTTNNPWMSNQVNIWSGQQASTTFNLGFDRAFSWMVSARDPYGAQRDSGWMGTYLTDRSPQGKVSDVLTYKAVNYNPSSNPRFVIDDAATRLQPVTVNDHSYDPDGNNQNVQATFWLEIYNAGTGSWQSLGSSALRPPTNIVGGTYYHDVPFNNLYAGQHRYRAQDRDACGAVSSVSSYYNFTIAPPAVKNITVNSGTAGCPACGNRNTAIVVDWDDVPYIQNAQSSGIGGGYYVEWSNDGGATYRAVTKSLPDATAGWTSDSRIVLVTDVLNLYNLPTSTARNIRYRVASYSNGVYSDWLYSNVVTYNCPIPGGLTLSPNPVDMRGDEDSQPLTARIHCRDFNGGVVGVLGGDMISAAQANRIYSPDTTPVSFVWNQTDITNLNNCSTGTQINTPPNPGNTIHAGSNTTVDPCEGKLGATLTNYGWPEIGALTGDTWISINPRATEEFNYSGEVISNPPPGFEKLDLPGMQ